MHIYIYTHSPLKSHRHKMCVYVYETDTAVWKCLTSRIPSGHFHDVLAKIKAIHVHCLRRDSCALPPIVSPSLFSFLFCLFSSLGAASLSTARSESLWRVFVISVCTQCYSEILSWRCRGGFKIYVQISIGNVSRLISYCCEFISSFVLSYGWFLYYFVWSTAYELISRRYPKLTNMYSWTVFGKVKK